jgi:hypothetical protein
LSSDDGACVALTAGVAAGCVENGLEVDVVALEEGGLTLVLGLNRADLDLDNAAVFVAFDFLKLGAREAGCNALDVSKDAPCIFHGNCNSELMI